MSKVTKKKAKVILVSAAGGVVYQQKGGKQEVLLIYKNKCWDLPKGHQEENESIKECATREVFEETGVREPIIEDSLLTTVHTYQRDGKAYRKTTYWFKMRACGDEEIKAQTAEGIEQVRWVPVSRAPDKLGYNSLKKVVLDFQSTF